MREANFPARLSSQQRAVITTMIRIAVWAAQHIRDRVQSYHVRHSGLTAFITVEKIFVYGPRIRRAQRRSADSALKLVTGNPGLRVRFVRV
jgi:hypothetical protein